MFDSSFFRLVYSIMRAKCSHTNPHSRSWLALWQTETWKQASCLRVTHKHGSSEQERKKKNKNKKTRISRMLLWQHWNAVRIMCDSFLRPWTFLYLAIHLLNAAIFFHAANDFCFKKWRGEKNSFQHRNGLKSVFNVQSTHIPCNKHVVVLRLNATLTVGWRCVCSQCGQRWCHKHSHIHSIPM